MKHNKQIPLILILMFTWLCSLTGQVDQARNFIYMFNDSIQYGRHVRYYPGTFFENARIEIDLREVNPGLVKFYKNNEGFYANTRMIAFSGSDRYARCIAEGRINLFETDKTTYTPGHYNNFNSATGMYGRGGYSPPMAIRTIKDFYSVGFGDLKKANYANLVVDLAGNSVSMAHLEKYKNLKNAEMIIGFGGLAVMIGGIVSFINLESSSDPDGPEPNITGPVVAIVGGAACTWISYGISLTKPKHIHRAVESFNR